MTNSLTSIFTELAVYTLLWAIVHETIYRLIPSPHSVKSLEGKEKDHKKRDLTFSQYVSFFPALLHAPVATIISCVCLAYYGVSYGKDIQPMEYWPIKFSVSYFLQDTFFGLRRKYNDKVTTSHHVLIVLMLCYSWYIGKYGSDICNGIAQGEVTNPVYAVYDVMTHMGYEEAKIRPIGIIFMVSFIIIRLGFAPLMMWKIQNSEADLFFKLASSGMWVISMMIIWMMFNKIAKLMYKVGDDHFSLTQRAHSLRASTI